jgi:hypothetical protein
MGEVSGDEEVSSIRDDRGNCGTIGRGVGTQTPACHSRVAGRSGPQWVRPGDVSACGRDARAPREAIRARREAPAGRAAARESPRIEAAFRFALLTFYFLLHCPPRAGRWSQALALGSILILFASPAVAGIVDVGDEPGLGILGDMAGYPKSNPYLGDSDHDQVPDEVEWLCGSNFLDDDSTPESLGYLWSYLYPDYSGQSEEWILSLWGTFPLSQPLYYEDIYDGASIQMEAWVGPIMPGEGQGAPWMAPWINSAGSQRDLMEGLVDDDDPDTLFIGHNRDDDEPSTATFDGQLLGADWAMWRLEITFPDQSSDWYYGVNAEADASASWDATPAPVVRIKLGGDSIGGLTVYLPYDPGKTSWAQYGLSTAWDGDGDWDTRLVDEEPMGTVRDDSWTTVGAFSAFNVTGPGSYSVTATWGDNNLLANSASPYYPVHLTDPDTNDGQVTTNTTVVLVVAGFFESASQVFGFDDFTTQPLAGPWKSIRIGTSDVADVVTTPSSAASHVYFQSGSPSTLSVSPGVASGSPEQLTLTSSSGAGNGSTVGVDARLNGTSGPQLALLRTAAYDLTTKSLAFRVVHSASMSSSTQSYTASQLDGYLQTIYDTAVAEFTSVTLLADMSVNYDLNQDGSLDT